MRIGLFTDQYYPFVSGLVTSIKLLYEGLEKLGHEVFIFTSMDEKLVDDSPEFKNKNIINLYGRPYPFKGLKDYRYTLTHKKQIKVIKQYNLDVIHVHTEYNIAKLAIKCNKKLHIPLVHTLHTLFEDYLAYFSPFFNKIMHRQMMWGLKVLFLNPISKRSEFNIVPTKKVANQMNKYGLKNRNVRIIPTGIETERFNPNNFTKEEIDSLREELGISKDKFVYLYIGRVSQEKNISSIVNAYKKSLADNDNTVLLIVGGGPYLDDLKNLVNELGISDKVIFTNIVTFKDISKYYQLGDIFVNASKSETQGLTYIEALSASIPLLVQNDECLDGVVQNYYNGILFDGEEELAIKLQEILKAPDVLRAMKKNTMKSTTEFTKEAFCKKVLNVYEDSIESYNKKHKKKNK